MNVVHDTCHKILPKPMKYLILFSLQIVTIDGLMLIFYYNKLEIIRSNPCWKISKDLQHFICWLIKGVKLASKKVQAFNNDNKALLCFIFLLEERRQIMLFLSRIEAKQSTIYLILQKCHVIILLIIHMKKPF